MAKERFNSRRNHDEDRARLRAAVRATEEGEGVSVPKIVGRFVMTDDERDIHDFRMKVRDVFEGRSDEAMLVPGISGVKGS